MTNANEKEREDRALEALIVAAFHSGQDDPDSYDDPRILDKEDKQVLEALGDDFVDRALAGEPTLPTRPLRESGAKQSSRPRLASMHRGGDENVTEKARQEMEEERRKLFEENEGEGEKKCD